MNKNMFFFKFCLLLKAGRHAKASPLPEGVPRNYQFLVDCKGRRGLMVVALDCGAGGREFKPAISKTFLI